MSEQTIKLSVANMKCNGCVLAIESALKEVKNIDDIRVSLDKQQASVSTSLSSEEIAKIITDAGFPATPL